MSIESSSSSIDILPLDPSALSLQEASLYIVFVCVFAGIVRLIYYGLFLVFSTHLAIIVNTVEESAVLFSFSLSSSSLPTLPNCVFFLFLSVGWFLMAQ